VSAEEAEHAPSELAARSRVIVRRSIGSPILFTIVYSSLASAIYFSLGVIAGHALGLTPLQQSDLVAFLEALAGPGADPQYQHSP